MSTDEVEVFLGDTVEDDAEFHVLNRLCADLAARGVPARVHANFYTKRRGRQRQIDFFVVTSDRAVLVELKNFDPGLPLIAGVNGPWKQTLPGGRRRILDGNGYRQALNATYSLADIMRALADRHEVPDEPRFPKCIDTVVCVYPRVAAGSEPERADHVTLVDYDELVRRLSRPDGPRPRWSPRDWDTLTRELGLYRLGSGEDTADAQLGVLEDYCRRFLASHRPALHELVPLVAEIDGVYVGQYDPAVLARHGQMVTIVGSSGGGKTHRTLHAALELSAAGHLVLWARCSDYRSERLSALLARAAAPFSTAGVLSLIDLAGRLGREAVLVLDGLNECEPDAREVLLEQLASLRLRHRVATVVTSTEPVPHVDDATVTQVLVRLPDPDERAALLRSHGAGGLETLSEAFATPYELSLAAECAHELPADASRAQLYEAYIRRRAGSVTTRAVLRAIARQLDERMSSAAPIGEVITTLERSDDQSVNPAAIDAALDCPLLSSTQGRLRFGHDLLARFLAAQDLVHRSATGTELAVLLDDPRHRDLVEFAVDLESTPARRYRLLRGIGDSERLRTGLLGHYGPELQSRLRADARGVLAAAYELTATARLDAPDLDSPFIARWCTEGALDAADRSLLAAAARCLEHGLFVDDVAALLDVTDQRGQAAVASLRERGSRIPVTLVVGATYAAGRRVGDEPLPASLVAEATEHRAMFRFGRDTPDDVAPAAALWQSGRRRGWGLLFVALHLLCPTNPTDRAVFPDLLAAAWRAGGYHLQLATLMHAQRAGRALEGSTAYDAVRDFLEGLHPPTHWALSSMLVEALAVYDAIEPINTLDALREEIAALLAAPRSDEADAAAFRVFSRQFENEQILGPYCEAIASFSEVDQTRLLVKAARGRSPYGMFADSLLTDIARRATRDDSEAIAVLQHEATHLDTDSGVPQDTVAAHLAAVIGLAAFTHQLPEADETAAWLPRAWRLVDELLFALSREDPGELEDVGRRCWPELLGPEARTAVDVVYNLSSARSCISPEETSAYHRLASQFPDQLRRLLEWGLIHPTEVLSSTRLVHGAERSRFVIQELGRLGDARTVDLLRPWVGDPALGDAAVEALRRLST